MNTRLDVQTAAYQLNMKPSELLKAIGNGKVDDLYGRDWFNKGKPYFYQHDLPRVRKRLEEVAPRKPYLTLRELAEKNGLQYQDIYNFLASGYAPKVEFAMQQREAGTKGRSEVKTISNQDAALLMAAYRERHSKSQGERIAEGLKAKTRKPYVLSEKGRAAIVAARARRAKQAYNAEDLAKVYTTVTPEMRGNAVRAKDTNPRDEIAIELIEGGYRAAAAFLLSKEGK